MKIPVFRLKNLIPSVHLSYRHTGISLNPQKMEMVRGRLSKRLRTLGLNSYKKYYEYLTGNALTSELPHLIDAISTNKTSFFREPRHFEYLRDVILPVMTSKKRQFQKQRFRIWSAGCSTGEEPYSIAMEMARANLLSSSTWDTQILGTDISEEVLRHARKAIYLKKTLGELSADDIGCFLCKIGQEEYLVSGKLRTHVQLRRLNLHDDTFPFRGPFDIIFCRNVMIYFDPPSKQKLLEKYYRLLEPGGYLFIGHSESLSGLQTEFQYLRPAVYQKQ